LMVEFIWAGVRFKYNWQGFVSASEKSLKNIRLFFLISFLGGALNVAWVLIYIVRHKFDRSSPDSQRALWQIFLSLQIMMSLCIFIYSLVGINGIYSPKGLLLTLNPLDFLLKRRKN
jgi:hypothetical protein